MTRAFLVYKQLQQQGLVPNQRTFMPLIDVCGRVGKLDRAFSLLAEMKNRGLAPNRDIYTRLMEACSQSGAPEQAFVVFRQMMVRFCVPGSTKLPFLPNMLQGESSKRTKLLSDFGGRSGYLDR